MTLENLKNAMRIDFATLIDEGKSLEEARLWFFSQECKDIYEDDYKHVRLIVNGIYNELLKA